MSDDKRLKGRGKIFGVIETDGDLSITTINLEGISLFELLPVERSYILVNRNP